MEPIEIVRAIKAVDDYNGIILLNNYVKKLNQQKKSSTPSWSKEVLSHLNEKTKSNFRGGKSFDRYVSARANEGFTLEDFKKVIDIKAKEWLGTEYESYLRPETLFGNRMDSYLQQEKKTDVGDGFKFV